jgi:hypothetical protein
MLQMRKKPKPKRRKPSSLLQTTKKGQIELTERELERVSGGSTQQVSEGLALKPVKF